jgi:hypothetical protein
MNSQTPTLAPAFPSLGWPGSFMVQQLEYSDRHPVGRLRAAYAFTASAEGNRA